MRSTPFWPLFKGTPPWNSCLGWVAQLRRRLYLFLATKEGVYPFFLATPVNTIPIRYTAINKFSPANGVSPCHFLSCDVFGNDSTAGIFVISLYSRSCYYLVQPMDKQLLLLYYDKSARRHALAKKTKKMQHHVLILL